MHYTEVSPLYGTYSVLELIASAKTTTRERCSQFICSQVLMYAERCNKKFLEAM